jgi:hypothetical protein
LLLLRKHGNIVLEGVRDPKTLVVDIGDALMLVPVVWLGESLLDNIVKVLVGR